MSELQAHLCECGQEVDGPGRCADCEDRCDERECWECDEPQTKYPGEDWTPCACDEACSNGGR